MCKAYTYEVMYVSLIKIVRLIAKKNLPEKPFLPLDLWAGLRLLPYFTVQLQNDYEYQELKILSRKP